MKPPANGFTLVEVLVVLVLAGWVLVTAGRVFVSMSDAAERMSESSRIDSASYQAESALRALFERSDPRVDALIGGPSSIRLGSWCDGAHGWLEQCIATVAIAELSDGLAVAITTGNQEPILVRRGLRSAHITYLQSGAEGGVWRGAWLPSMGRPVAVAFALDTDTLLSRVGIGR